MALSSDLASYVFPVVALLLALCVGEFLGNRLWGSERKKRFLPVAGTIFHQLGNFRRLHDFQTELCCKYKTFRLPAPLNRQIYTWDPQYIEYILQNNFQNYGKSSNLFDNLTQGIAPPAHYIIQGKNYDVRYYLADGVYPKWSTLVQTISQSEDKKKQYFAMMQEARRKDIERTFGVVQSRFAIIKGPARFWDKRTLHDIMTACVIMHNMIIGDERDEQEDVISTPPSFSNVEDMEINQTKRFRRSLLDIRR